MPNNSESLASLRVLLVDDSEAIQRLMSHQLKSIGMEVTIAMDGRQGAAAALRAVRNDRSFDIVFMDIDMPRMDGRHATRLLRDRGYKGPIIALTASTMPGEQQQCIDAGCNDYVAKPINKPHLLAVMRRFARSPVNTDD